MKTIDLACIIEDESVHLLIIKKNLELTGLIKNTLVFENGKDAFLTLKEMIQNNEKLPEIIFLDLNMPVWDGWRFLDEFTQIPIENKITIYILTSSNREEDLKRAESYQLNDKYLIKPIKQHQIKEVLNEFV